MKVEEEEEKEEERGTYHVHGTFVSNSQSRVPPILHQTTHLSTSRSCLYIYIRQCKTRNQLSFPVPAAHRLSRAEAQQTINHSHHYTRPSRLSPATTGYSSAASDYKFVFQPSVCSLRHNGIEGGADMQIDAYNHLIGERRLVTW